MGEGGVSKVPHNLYIGFHYTNMVPCFIQSHTALQHKRNWKLNSKFVKIKWRYSQSLTSFSYFYHEPCKIPEMIIRIHLWNEINSLRCFLWKKMNWNLRYPKKVHFSKPKAEFTPPPPSPFSRKTLLTEKHVKIKYKVSGCLGDISWLWKQVAHRY